MNAQGLMVMMNSHFPKVRKEKNWSFRNELLIFSFGVFIATVQKLINEMMPDDIVCAKDTRDLLIDCCVGKI
jgi:hypothetical protein